MLFLQRIFSYNFKDNIFIYYFLCLEYVDVPGGIYVWLFGTKDILFIQIIMFLQSKAKRLRAMFLSNFETSGNR